MTCIWVDGQCFALCSLAHSCDCTLTIMPTRRVGSKSNTVLRRSRSGFRAELLLLSTLEQLLGAMLVRGEA